MIRTLAIAAAAAATLSAPVLAAVANTVISQHNMSADLSEQISVGPNGPVLGTTVSTRGDSALADAIRHLNADKRASQRVDSENVTVFSGQPAFAADIFEQLRDAADHD